MNKPQLSAEMEKRFDEGKFLLGEDASGNPVYLASDEFVTTQIKHFLATALEEQKQKVLDEVDEQLRQFQLIYGSFNSSTGDIMGYRISEHEESADVLIRYLRTKLNQLKEEE